MRKIVLFIAALLFMVVPAMAVVSNVNITCVPDGNKVTVSYASNLNRIRAFGLDIDVVGANITKLDVVDANYRIYPGQIVIVDGNVIDYNTPYVPGDLGDANVTIEMGSLYTTDANYASDPNAGYNKIPGLSGTLLKFYVSGNCTYAVTENAIRGGIVMEDPNEDPNVTLCSGSVTVGCIVPNVVGGSSADANTAIIGAGLTVGNRTGVLSCAPVNQVLAQSPVGGTVVTCGSTVDYNYSLYQTTEPNVVHMTQAAACAAIVAANLVCNPVDVNGGAEPIGQVVSQSPAPGTQTCGTTVTINVASYCLDPVVTPAAEYNAWVAWGRPSCWCFKRQCRGDVMGTKIGTWVSLADFNLLKSAFNKADTVLKGVPNGICSDLDHTKIGTRVSLADFNILKSYFNKAETSVPCCDLDKNCVLTTADKYNFWTKEP
jgi:hypothetical protein